MKTLEKILAEIEDLQQQAADIQDSIKRIEEDNGIWCQNCQFYDAYCRSRWQFPACFRPDEEWREKYEKKAVEDSV